MNTQFINYNIISCTSVDKNYPIISIQNASIRSNGWQSLPNPTYPIDFIIDLNEPIELDNLQFVSHQSKIPTRVDLSYSNNPAIFKPLGSFQFSDNSQTSFTARELKSVSLSHVITRYIKVSIRGCHSNAGNQFNQVGLVSLKIIGKSNIIKPSTPITSSRPLEFDLENIIENLEKQKKDAVGKEDFIEANKIKSQLDILKKKKDDLLKLQKEKQESIDNEDYDNAREIKKKIEELLLVDNESLRPKTQQKPFKQQIFDEDTSIFNKKINKIPKNEENDIFIDDDIRSNNDLNHLGDERPIKPALHALSDDDNFEEEEIFIKPISKKNKFINEKNIEILEDLSPLNYQESNLLILKFGEEILKKIFSKNWSLKLEGIKLIIEKLLKQSQKTIFPLFNNFCYILRNQMNDNNKQIIITSLRGIQSIVEEFEIYGEDLSKAINPLITPLELKIGSSQQQVSDTVCEFFVWLTQMHCSEIVLPIIMGEIKNPNLWKSLLSKLISLKDLIDLHGFDSLEGLTIEEVMKFIIPSLESTKIEVRTAVINIFVSIESIIGNQIIKYLNKLSIRSKKEIEKAIEKSHENI